MSSLRMKAIGVAILVVSALVGVAAMQSHELTRVAAAQSTSQDPAVLKAAFGIRFTTQLVASGARPVLPGGQPGVSMDDAMRTAMTDSPAVGVATVSGELVPDSQISAQYGTFSDEKYGRIDASGRVQPEWQNRPVWIVTFAGPGVQLPSHNPRVKAVHHELSVVLDAATGQYLMAYAYR